MKLRPYHAYLELLVGRFDDLSHTHMPRAQNWFADALANLVSMIDILKGVIVRPLLVETRVVPAYYSGFDDGLPWYHDIYQFLRYDTYPEVVND